jgi:hypothetical protein
MARTKASWMPLASIEVSAAYVVPPFDVTRSRSVDTGSDDSAASAAAPRNVSTASLRPCSADRPISMAARSIASTK